LCTLENAETACEDIGTIMKEIHEKARIGSKSLTDSGFAGYSMRIIEKIEPRS
jgi:hypothetical protein